MFFTWLYSCFTCTPDRNMSDLVNSVVEKYERLWFVATISDEVIEKVDNCYLDEYLAHETYVKGEDTISILRLQLYPWVLKDKSFHKQVERNIFLYWLQNFSEVSACWKFCSVGYWLCGGSDGYRHESLSLNCPCRKIFFYNECNNKQKAKLTVIDKLNKRRKVCAH